MAAEFKNAAPMFISRGADDKSGRVILKENAGLPQHLGKFYIWAKKGPKEPQLLSPDDLARMYGDETFDYIHKWYNHQTRFVLGSSGEGNAVMVQRLIPSDAGVRSNVNLYMDVLETDVNNYLRYSNGDIVVDENGVKQIDPKKPKVKGYKVKFITESNLDTEPEQEGLLTAKQGTMTRREVSYVDSETETEIIMVPSETEFEDKEVIVEGEFEMVEEDSPTETETRLVPSDTEFDVTYEDSTTDFETVTVGTGEYEDVVERDESLDEWVKDDVVDFYKPIENLKPISAEFIMNAHLLETYKKDLVDAGITTVKMKTTTGSRKDNCGLAVVYTFDMLRKKHPGKFRLANILNDFAADDNIYKLFPDFGKVTNVGYSKQIPNIRIKNKVTGEIQYMHTATLLTNKQYVNEIQSSYVTWVEKPGTFLLSSSTDFNASDSIYEVEYVLIDEKYLSYLDAKATHWVASKTYYPASAKVTASASMKFLAGALVGNEAKCVEDLKNIPNPKNEINLMFKYKLYDTDQWIYANNNDLTKFYTIDLNRDSMTYEYKLFGGLEDLDFKIPTLESLGEGYDTAPLLFNVAGATVDNKIELRIILNLERQPVVFEGTGTDVGKLFISEPIGKLQTETEVTVDLTKAGWNKEGKIVGDSPVVLTAAEGKLLPVDMVKYLIDNRIGVNLKKVVNSRLVEGYRTTQVEIMETKQVPVKIEIKTPKLVEKEVPKKIMVKRPKKATIQVPKLVEKEVPKKVEVVKLIPSTMYPIMEVRAKYQGEFYNNLGFSIGTSYLEKFNNELARSTKMFPYSLSLWTRKSIKHAPEYNKTLDGEIEMEFLLTDKPTRDPKTDGLVDFNNIYKSNWFNETSPIKDYRPFDFEYFKIYENNLDKLLKDFIATEKEVISELPKQFKDGLGANTEWYDFVDNDYDSQFKLINPFTCKTSKNVRYQTIVLSEDRPELRPGMKEVNISGTKPIFLDGGSDGTLSNEEYEKLFQVEISKYDDLNSEVQSLAVNKESTLWDSGFTLETKKYFPKFISKRKDTWIMLSTHDASLGKKYFNISQSKAIAASLNTALKLAPESTFYGTGVTRGQIIMGAGIPEDGTTDDYVALTYEVLLMISRFAGAGNGKWKREYLYDKMPNNIIKTLKDIQPSFIPEGAKPSLWESNLVYAQNSDRTEYFFPAQQTVYDNDTSVLNNSFAIIALATSVKVSFEVWQEFTGDTELTPAEFKNAIETRLTEKLSGKFAGLIDVEVECIIDSNDAKRGFSWKHVIKLFGNVMKTVCVHTTEMYRKTA